MTIYYAFKQSEEDEANDTASTGWETFLDAVIRAGLATVEHGRRALKSQGECVRMTPMR